MSWVVLEWFFLPFSLSLQTISLFFVFHHSIEHLCDGYCYMEKLLNALLTYDVVRNLGCVSLFFCLLAIFLWSGRLVHGFFVMCLDLGNAVCHMQVMFLKAYGK
jgi:hypothetical protein